MPLKKLLQQNRESDSHKLLGKVIYIVLSFFKVFGKIFSYMAIGFVKFYQTVISPYLAPSCRYTPTCSQYAIESYKTHNIFFATILVLKRILKCSPLGGYGYDPVPKRKHKI